MQIVFLDSARSSANFQVRLHIVVQDPFFTNHQLIQNRLFI